MAEEKKNNSQKETDTKKKGFFIRFIEKIDKKMEEKSKKNSCCKGKGCC